MSLRQLPALFIEFRDLAKEYFVQEISVPAQQLGHLSGFSLGAALAWSLAIILLAVASLRAIIDALPDGAYWEALGYLTTVVALGLVAFIIYKAGPQPEDEPEPEAS